MSLGSKFWIGVVILVLSITIKVGYTKLVRLEDSLETAYSDIARLQNWQRDIDAITAETLKRETERKRESEQFGKKLDGLAREKGNDLTTPLHIPAAAVDKLQSFRIR